MGQKVRDVAECWAPWADLAEKGNGSHGSNSREVQGSNREAMMHEAMAVDAQARMVTVWMLLPENASCCGIGEGEDESEGGVQPHENCL